MSKNGDTYDYVGVANSITVRALLVHLTKDSVIPGDVILLELTININHPLTIISLQVIGQKGSQNLVEAF